MHNSLRVKNRVIWLYLLPILALYTFIVIFPIFNAMNYSLFKWSGGPVRNFIGLQNYKNLISDKLFWGSFKNNILITFYCLIGQIGGALVISTLFTLRSVRLRQFHRAVIFFPSVLAGVVVGFIWVIMYNQHYGFISAVLQKLHLGSFVIPWLDDPKYVIISVSIPLMWQFIGFYSVILMAGMTNISSSIFEVAEIDGASWFTKLIFITIPLIKETVIVTIMLCISGNMKIFGHIFIMTNGGPGNSSMVMAMYAYHNSFIKNKLGYGSAISIAILILSLTLVIISRKIANLQKKGIV